MTRNETAILADPTGDDQIVRDAWTAIAQAQDNVARLAKALERARALRARAQGLQDQALRFRYRDPPSPRGGPGPARRMIDGE
jgi:hypothetical protein